MKLDIDKMEKEHERLIGEMKDLSEQSRAIRETILELKSKKDRLNRLLILNKSVAGKAALEAASDALFSDYGISEFVSS